MKTAKEPRGCRHDQAFVRPLGTRIASDLKRRFCKRQIDQLYGQRRFVTPELVPFRWGNGRQIIGIRPLILRRSWYVVAIDNRMQIGRPTGCFDEDDEFRELLDDSIYPEIEEYFGRVDWDESQTDEFDAHAAWPMVNHEVGHEWFCLGDR